MIARDYDKTIREIKTAQGKKLRKTNYFLDTKTTKKIMTEPIGGKTVNEWVDNNIAGLKSGIRSSLTQSVILGDTLTQAAKTLKNTMQLSRKGANFIGKTGMLQASNASRNEAYDQNQDFIKAYQYVSTLDIRTCPICGNLDGTTRKKLDALPAPPVHGLCRCTIRPITEFERLCGEFAKMFVEDIQKFGRIDKDGTMWIDDGIQKMMVGRCK